LPFDLGVLDGLRVLNERSWRIRSLYTKGSTSVLSISRGSQSIRLLDNMNYFKSSLAALGKLLNMEKGSVDFANVGDAELSEYCRNDARIMLAAWKMLYSFLDEHDLGKWCYTLPSQAFNAFRHRFMSSKLLIHGDTRAVEMERAAYHGGRTSVFYVGAIQGRTLYKLDVNSMYPFAMVSCPMPVRLLDVHENPPLREVEKWSQEKCVIARVKIRSPEPCFPLVRPFGNVYPVGSYWTTLSTPEIRYAFERGYIQECSSCCVYDASFCFDAYVDYFFALKNRYKAENNPAFYALTKLYLNGLYGKFGQKSTDWERVEDPEGLLADLDFIIDAATGRRITLHRFGNEIWQCSEGGEAPNAMPAIAAHVTAFSRMYLWQLIIQAGQEHVYYVDTDSLIVDELGLENLRGKIDPDRLGALKIEDKSTETKILAPKEYWFNQQWTRKGIPAKALKVGEWSWEFDATPGLLGQSRWKKEETFHVTRITKTLTHKISDGTVGPDGWVAPVKVAESEGETREMKQKKNIEEKLLNTIRLLREDIVLSKQECNSLQHSLRSTGFEDNPARDWYLLKLPTEVRLAMERLELEKVRELVDLVQEQTGLHMKIDQLRDQLEIIRSRKNEKNVRVNG